MFFFRAFGVPDLLLYSRMQVPVFVLDTFTSIRFKGNPTAVCVLEEPLHDEQLLSIAQELNMPVTAFVLNSDDASLFYIRYFTTITEISACGHATLASSQVVFELLGGHTVTFKTIEGVTIDVRAEKDVIIMTYPAYALTSFAVSPALLKSLSIEKITSAGFNAELQTLFIELDDAAVLRSVQPDFKALTASSSEIIEVVITSRSDDPQYDYLLRSFCPWIGINEDPVTGSVHSVLAGYWKQRLRKSRLTVWQASERGGELYVTAFDTRVELGGKTVIVMQGLLHV
jgi:PhzF family phenazine biosynthesis protein